MAALENHYDVLIIGAGLSGIGMGAHLVRKSPDKSFAILEARERMGGTWDLFRYPGVRSDSDMFTFGYKFRPWRDNRAIAPGGAIRDYLQGTIDDYDLTHHIHFKTRVAAANWDSADKLWHLQVQGSDGETSHVTCCFMVSATGYYNYEHGHQPNIPGLDDFAGDTLHPQFWPEGYDYAKKRVVVIGSGATAVTLVPSMAGKADHVTMLQRSPTYMFNRPSVDPLSRVTSAILPARLSHRINRFVNVYLSTLLWRKSKREPDKIRHFLRKMAVSGLGEDYPIDVHFNPRYKPWDERLCVIPDGDLFEVIKDGSASVVTDRIKRVVADGIELESGDKLAADTIVTATGLELQFFGGIDITVDGARLEPGEKLVYRGMMLDGVPNCVAIFGYANASWTLKSDLTSDYVCRLLKHMDKRGQQVAVPELGQGPRPAAKSLIGLKSGYIERAQANLPKQGDVMPWQNHENFFKDYRAIRWGGFDDGTLKLR